MNTRKCRAKFKNFQTLLYSGCIYTILTERLVKKLSAMQWHMQDGNITTNIKVKADSTLLTLITTNIMTWKCHLYDPAKGRHYMILEQYLLTELGLNLKFSDHVIKSDDRPFKGSTTPMVDLGTYEF